MGETWSEVGVVRVRSRRGAERNRERRGGGEESSGKGEVAEGKGSPPRRQSPVCRERS